MKELKEIGNELQRQWKREKGMERVNKGEQTGEMVVKKERD